MASRYEVEVTLQSAKDLKNVNWRHGPLRPYAVVWVDPKNKCSTKVDEEGDTCPIWEETLIVPLLETIEDSTLCIDVVHAGAEEDTKPLIGSARLKLRELADDVGLGERATRTLLLKRPSDRPHGKVEVEVEIRKPRYHAHDAHYAPPYGVPPPPQGSRDYPAPPAYGNPYAPPQNPYYSTAPPPAVGYPYGAYNAQPYGQSSYGQAPYSEGAYGYGKEEKKSKFGMGTGLAVGAGIGILGGVALAEGADYVEDQIADDVAEKVEDDIGYEGDDF